MARMLTLFCAVLIISTGILLAGTTGKIAGHVRDAQTHEALAGVNIVIEGTALGAAADPDGYYVILNVPPGKHNIVASGVGYVKKTYVDVTVSIDLTTTLDIDLSSTVLELSKEVVVTAERPAVQKDLTSSEARVDASQIKTLPVTEVAEVLTLQSGITTDRSGGIHIRGGRTNEVAYWIDGVSVSDAYDGSQAVQVDNNAIQELQVISGTFNAEYGQATSGIVNIVTKDGQSNYHGSLSAYSGGHFSSNGWKFDNRYVYLNETLYNLYSRKSDEIFYNLNKYRPFDTYNIEGSLSGPFPDVNGLTFYASGRYYKTNGYLYGDGMINPNGSLEFDPAGHIVIDPATGQISAYQPPDNPVPMNDSRRYSGQAKVTYQLTGTTKLSLSGLFSDINYRDYNQDYFFVPDGDVRKYDKGYEGSALWTQTLNSTSFYTINLSYFLKSFKEYLYEDPTDSRYVLDPTLYTKGLYEFNHLGTNAHHFQRGTETRVAKVDYTNQINQLHQLKMGVETKLYRLYLEDYSSVLNSENRPSIPDRLGPLYQEYTREPVELAAYVQDKLEYEHMIVNIGLRLDYFNSRGSVLTDPLDPNVYLPQKPENQGLTLDERYAKWFKRATKKWSVSPRLGISYPITDKGVLHFSYGHFLKIPSFIYLYQNPDYKVTTATGVQGVYGNPDLKPERTIQYEFGLQQQLAANLNFDITGFYRDTRDWVQASVQHPVRDAATATTYYTIYVNRDYANTRGLTLSVERRPTDILSFNLGYTLQSAEGINSNPDDEQAAQQNNQEPARSLTPLEWDQTHTFNLTVGLGRQSWGVFFIGRYGSGLPYTPTINQGDLRGVDVARVVLRNSRRQPETYTVDLRAFKNFSIDNLNLSVFVKVFNLFDRRNDVNVYSQTGQATATLAALGATSITGTGRLNPVSAYIIQPGFYTEPREIQFGAEFNF